MSKSSSNNFDPIFLPIQQNAMAVFFFFFPSFDRGQDYISYNFTCTSKYERKVPVSILSLSPIILDRKKKERNEKMEHFWIFKREK